MCVCVVCVCVVCMYALTLLQLSTLAPRAGDICVGGAKVKGPLPDKEGVALGGVT